MPETSNTNGLEVQVWLRCESTEDLWRFAQVLDDPDDGSERVPPPEGRRNMVLTWSAPAEIPTDGPPEPWQDTFLYGMDQARYLTDRGAEHGINVYVYAVRVQPIDAEFEPLIVATTGEDSARRAETRMPERVRTDQPTIVTLEETMATARLAALAAFTDAGFENVQLVVNVVATSLDPDDGHHTWAAGSCAPDQCDPLLAESLRQSAEEAAESGDER